MGYPEPEWERAMKVHEVIARALSGEIHWFRAADILGVSARTLRRWREHYEVTGYDGLLDQRRRVPSPHKVPVAELERILHLYREQYAGFNVQHFHEIARREHEVTLSYSWVKQALQQAGLVRTHRARGRHRRRREPRACFGELLHVDGSPHAWFARVPELRATLITVLDDATGRVLYGQLWPQETTQTIMTALHEVLTTFGLPMAVYTDRAHWAFHTPCAKGPVDKAHPTQVGRAFAMLGIEHIPAYSPQARGRSERLNRTVQDRLVNELRVAGLTTLGAANQYLRERFWPQFNATFGHPPRDPASAWVPLGPVDLDQILCRQEARVVGQDNTVVLDRVVLQLERQPGRRTCAGLEVLVRRHLTAQYSIWRGPQRLGLFDPNGQPVDAATAVHGRQTRPRTRRVDRPPRTPAGPQRPQALTARR